MALIRYPGSKEKLADAIVERLPDEVTKQLWSAVHQWEYREPFFGAGAIGFRVLANLSPKAKVWLNDIDRGIVCLWRSVRYTPTKLIELISNFAPTAERFYEFKASDGDESLSELQAGFRKLALHQMSVSGFGAKSGGPLGGKDQSNAAYPVDCRWNPQRLRLHVIECHKRMKKFDSFQFTHGDFQPLVETADERCSLYLDPPYVEKGWQLYKYNMQVSCHERLSRLLCNSPANWVLSYDDHPIVRSLYCNCEIETLQVIYSNAVCRDLKRPKNGEVVITPKRNEE